MMVMVVDVVVTLVVTVLVVVIVDVAHAGQRRRIPIAHFQE